MIVQTKNGIMLHGEIAKDPVLRDLFYRVSSIADCDAVVYILRCGHCRGRS